MSHALLYADRLIDGTNDRPVESPVIEVRDGRIARVAQQAPASTTEPRSNTIDLSGCTLLPGLIDVHVHLNLPGDGTDFRTAMQESDEVLAAAGAFAAATALRAGITTLRDVGSRRDTTLALRRALELGAAPAPRLLVSAEPLTITGGHTWYLGGEVEGEDALRTRVRDHMKRGVDLIKVIGSGGGTPNTRMWAASYTEAELRVIAETAHELGRKVTVHCLCAEATRRAIRAGVDQIEHAGFLIDDEGTQRYEPEVASELASAEIPVTPTLSVGSYIVEALSNAPGERAVLERWKRLLEDNLRNIDALQSEGVQFAAGTDAGWRYTPFDALAEEVSLMQQAGIAAMAAIKSATSQAALVIGVDGETGSVREGLVADLIAVQGNPLEDIGSLRRVVFVMRKGSVASDVRGRYQTEVPVVGPTWSTSTKRPAKE